MTQLSMPRRSHDRYLSSEYETIDIDAGLGSDPSSAESLPPQQNKKHSNLNSRTHAGCSAKGKQRKVMNCYRQSFASI